MEPRAKDVVVRDVPCEIQSGIVDVALDPLLAEPRAVGPLAEAVTLGGEETPAAAQGHADPKAADPREEVDEGEEAGGPLRRGWFDRRRIEESAPKFAIHRLAEEFEQSLVLGVPGPALGGDPAMKIRGYLSNQELQARGLVVGSLSSLGRHDI